MWKLVFFYICLDVWQGHSVLPKTFSVILVSNVDEAIMIMISFVSVLVIICLWLMKTTSLTKLWIIGVHSVIMQNLTCHSSWHFACCNTSNCNTNTVNEIQLRGQLVVRLRLRLWNGRIVVYLRSFKSGTVLSTVRHYCDISSKGAAAVLDTEMGQLTMQASV